MENIFNDFYKVAFGITHTACECRFTEENIHFYSKIDEMYEQVDMNDEEIERVLISKCNFIKVIKNVFHVLDLTYQ